MKNLKYVLYLIGLIFIYAICLYLSSRDVSDSPLIIAHRGDSRHAPENTMQSFLLAVASGADSIELDIRETKDHVLVTLHDANLKRTTGHDAFVSCLPFKETNLCSLEQVFATLGSHTLYNLDLKITGIEKETVSLIQKYGLSSNCMITSSNPDSLKQISDLDSDIQTFLLLSDKTPVFPNYDFFDGISIKSCCLTKALVNDIHSNGKSVLVWTVNSKLGIRLMCHLGVDGIITDDPQKTVRYMEAILPGESS